jgi:hypothetical protein
MYSEHRQSLTRLPNHWVEKDAADRAYHPKRQLPTDVVKNRLELLSCIGDEFQQGVND